MTGKPTPNPTEADLHAVDRLIESAASEQTSIEADAIAREIVDELLADPAPGTCRIQEISIEWDQDERGRFTRDFDAVMLLVDMLRDLGRDRDTWRENARIVTAERDRWRRVALAWPWVAAALVFGWGMTVWGLLAR